MITDPLGRRVGYNPASDQIVNEIPGAFYSGIETEEEFIIIPGDLDGDYQLTATGIDDGDFAVTTHVVDSLSTQLINIMTGTTALGQVSTHTLTYAPNTGLIFADYITSPELRYIINFTTTGVYTVWLRGYAPNGAGDSVYLALENEKVATTPVTLTGFAPRRWSWANSDPQNGVATITVTEPGVYTLHLWQREDGLRLDRILLTTDSSYQPSSDGPLESERR